MGHFKLLSLLSCTITTVLSLFWIIVSGLSLAYRHNCLISDCFSKFGSDYMWMLFYKQYILDERCAGAAFLSQLTSTHTIHIFTIVSLTFAATSLIASVLLMISIYVKSCNKFVEAATYFHVTSYVSGFIVDLAFAMLLGADYMSVTGTMDSAVSGFAGNYGLDVLRIAILMVSILVMKGVVAPLINMGIIGLMLLCLTGYVQERDAQNGIAELPVYQRRTRSGNVNPMHNIEDLRDVSEGSGMSTASGPIVSGGSLRVRGDISVATDSDLEHTSPIVAVPQLLGSVPQNPGRAPNPNFLRPILPGPSFRARELPDNTPTLEMVSGNRTETGTTPQFRRRRLPYTFSSKLRQLSTTRPIRAESSVFAREPVTFGINSDVEAASGLPIPSMGRNNGLDQFNNNNASTVSNEDFARY